MVKETWERVRSIVAEVVSLDQDQRAARLEELCGDSPQLLAEVYKLLGSDHSTATVVGGPSAASKQFFVDGRIEPGTTFSHYRVDRLLGEGGMGDVYAAEQTGPIQRDVALKIIRPGMDSRQIVARFEAERQVLARMDHPNIARVFDAGTTPEGRPFFAMELVRGTPITRFCATRKLDTEARLRLFLEVCDAVQHAHQKGVIHRDLKPSNILVADDSEHPVAKVIDFGIAKALSPALVAEQGLTAPMTQLGQVVGTPDYMSPEQADLEGTDIDTRTDVYSLGVVLFEILVGEVPIRTGGGSNSTPVERARRLREIDPPRPSVRLEELDRNAKVAGGTQDGTVGPASTRQRMAEYRRDLDWIVLKALAKERDRRYRSPAELAADLRRFLADQPISARPPSSRYRVRKFVRRHRVGVVAVAGALAAILTGAVAASVGFVQARQAEREAVRQAELARQESRTAERVSSFLVDLFDAADPFSGVGPDSSARELIEQGARHLDDSLADEPAVRARLLMTLAEVNEGLGLLDRAEDLGNQGLQIYREFPERTSRGAEASAHERMVDILVERGQIRDAHEVAQRGVELAEQSGDPRILGAALAELGSTYVELGELEQANSTLDRAISILDTTDDVVGQIRALTGSTQPLLMQGRLPEAEERLRRVIERHEALGSTDLQSASAWGALGEVIARQERFDEAEVAVRRSRELFESSLGPSHIMSLRARGSVGALLLRIGQTEEARALLQDGLELAERDHEGNLLLIANFNNDLGKAHEDLGLLDVAWSNYERAAEIGRDVFGEDHPFVAFVYNNWGAVARLQGKLDEAQRLDERSLDIKRRTLSPQHPTVISSLQNLGLVAAAQGRVDVAEAYYREGLELVDQLEPVPQQRRDGLLNRLSDLLENAGRNAAAAQARAQLSTASAGSATEVPR